LHHVRVAATLIAYNANVGSWTGRPLAAFMMRREESPNSTEQCAG